MVERKLLQDVQSHLDMNGPYSFFDLVISKSWIQFKNENELLERKNALKFPDFKRLLGEQMISHGQAGDCSEDVEDCTLPRHKRKLQSMHH